MKWRHAKTGRTYEIVAAMVKMQLPDDSFSELQYVVYKDTETYRFYVCPFEQFTDGRFVRED